jgi:pimeloyl-ACP methyl ester carboxylesterase
MFVEVGGIRQWLEIEGDGEKPVLLLVHGGPGASTRFASGAWTPWREHFCLVHWDQRGAGRTFLGNGAENCRPMTFGQIVDDGLEVAEFLCRHLAKERIFVLGHSWGSAVAAHMVKRCPDLFAAFAGTGMLINFRENETLNHAKLTRLAEAQDDAEGLATLARIGHPPYADMRHLAEVRQLGDRLLGGQGDSPFPRPPVPPTIMTAEDREAGMQAFYFSCTALIDDLWRVDLSTLGPRFDVPVFILMGTHDQQTPIELAEGYLAGVEAPAKAFVRFEGCHHFVHINRPDDFLEQLVAHLLLN